MTQVDSLWLPEPPRTGGAESPAYFQWEAPGGGARGFIQVPCYPVSRGAFDRTGAAWWTPFGDPSYKIFRRADGDTTLFIETRRPLMPETPAERDSAIDGIRKSLRQWGVGDLDWSKIPSVKPAVLWLFLADDGRLWVETPSQQGGVRTFDMYEPDGRYAGTATTSLAFVPLIPPVVRGDRLWAVVTDELGVAYVVRARLRPASGGEGGE